MATGVPAESLTLFLSVSALIAVLPAMLYWQYRRRRWWSMGAGLAAFILTLDHLMLKDRGSLWQTLAATAMLFGPSYLALAAFRAAMSKLGCAVSGGGAAAALSFSSQAVLAVVTISLHLFFFIAATIVDIATPALLSVVGDSVNCLYHLAQPVDFRGYSDQLNMLLAVLPTLVLATLLQGWLRRSRMVDEGTGVPQPH